MLNKKFRKKVTQFQVEKLVNQEFVGVTPPMKLPGGGIPIEASMHLTEAL